ncbi:MAG: LysR family transcriptional regulator [Isosphaeraceae bacterium]
MQFESLKIFCDVVRWASFSRGAAENGISQSSASQAVHQLELRLGVKLIDRSKRPLVPTPQGKVYYEGCKDLVGRYAEVENRVRSLGGVVSVTGTVSVASIYSVGLAHMTRFVRDFEELYPGASVRLEYLHPTRVVESVVGGAVELGLISYPRKWPELTVIPWREEELVLAVHPTHPLAGRASVDIHELEDETFVSYETDLSIRKAIDRSLRHHGVDYNVALEFDNIENIKRAVEIPAGVAILPEPTLEREVQAGTLAAVRIEGQDPRYKLTRPIAVIHRKNHPPGLTAARFLKLLTEQGGAVAAAGPPDTVADAATGRVRDASHAKP